MDKKPGLTTLRIIGGFAIAIGLFIGIWFLTVGLLLTLYAFHMDKDASVFLFPASGVVFSAMLITGGIGTLRRRRWARVFLSVTAVLGLIPTIMYIVSEIVYGFSKDGFGNKFFDAGSWIGGMIFLPFVTVMVILAIKFLNSAKGKELFKKEDRQ
ncbi:MAG: hypothetical protein PHE80_04570 [Candidatus Omnitrophica bacterium]|nr:hypothetical protein [Candidatus Omnitrophota bacterium]MDD5737739.1 hypothetical protein [Candidatus Omnitrophota bacterium]